ncbi:aminoglycoside phosphotransferase family protein [Candidatus Woesearchaeota archaeon]|nr:aminoglycoside phosphotransferase family protein [Candidatus Woesearchaeota archaeon]
MDLEEKISEEEIQESRRIGRQKTLASVSSGIVAGFVSALFHREDHLFPQPYFSLLWGSLTYGLLATLLAQPINMFSRRGFFPALRGMLLGLRFLKRGNLEQKIARNKQANIRFLEEARALARDPLAKRTFQVSLDITNGDYESALQCAVPLLEAYRKVHPWTSFWHAIRDRSVSITAAFADLNSYLPFLLGKGLEMLALGRPLAAEKHFSRACGLDHPLHIPMNCFYGYILDFRSKENKRIYEKSKQQWKKTLDLVLRDPSLVQQFRRLGESRHEVLEISGEGILKDTFIFKRYTPSHHLTKEYTLDQILYTLFGDQESVAQPLASFIHEDQQYLILRRVAGRPFAKMNLKQFMPFLSGFHASLEHHQHQFPRELLEPLDYAHFLEQKYVRRVPAERHRQKVITALHHLAQELDKQSRIPIHSDLHPHNILVGDRGFTILDPEHMCLATRYLDLASLLEHNHLVLTDNEREQALQAYHHGETDSPKSFEEIYGQYLRSALFRSLHVRGILGSHSYGFTEQEQQQLQQYYAERACASLQLLKSLDRQSVQPLNDLLLV